MLRGTSSIKQDSLRLSTNCACVRCSKKGLDCSRLCRCWWVKGLSMSQAPFSPNCWARRPYIRNPASKKKTLRLRDCGEKLHYPLRIQHTGQAVRGHNTHNTEKSGVQQIPAKDAFWKEPTRQSSICVSDTEILSKTRRLEHVRNQLGQCFFVAFLVPFTYRARDAVHCPSWVKSSHTRWSKHVSNSRHLSLFPNLQEIVDDHPLMAVLHLSNL